MSNNPLLSYYIVVRLQPNAGTSNHDTFLPVIPRYVAAALFSAEPSFRFGWRDPRKRFAPVVRDKNTGIGVFPFCFCSF